MVWSGLSDGWGWSDSPSCTVGVAVVVYLAGASYKDTKLVNTSADEIVDGS